MILDSRGSVQNTFLTEEVKNCILCNKPGTQSDIEFSKRLGLIDPFDIKICAGCNLRWLSPRPTLEEYDKIYTDKFYFGGDQSVESISELSIIRGPYFRSRVKQCEKIFPRKKLKILDIGSATGAFVHEALTLGHQADGVEVSREAIKKANQKYGIELIHGSINEIKQVDYYDVVHLNHVLEHMPDPNDSIAHCHRFLKNGGLLIIEVPQQFLNDLDRLKSVLKMSKQPEFNAYSLHHTYFFSPKALASIIENNGFSVIQLHTANSNRTPLYPFSLKNLILRSYLWVSDTLRKGGNIIEVYAKKTSADH